ncbi:hypothetical protein AHiyo1_28380 [Arthrobacter sp. Hiyo1]|nr:hypothetical protein AHiyo1_28380 [Arthrobacter sp. Hiyo1]
MSPTGISAKRAPGTSTSWTSDASVGANSETAFPAAAAGASDGSDADGSSPVVTFADGDFAAGVFAAVVLLDEEPREGELFATSVSGTSGVSTASGALRASGKKRSTGRDAGTPLPDAPAEAELGMRAPRPLPRPRRFSLISMSLRWNGKNRARQGYCSD